MTLKEIKYQGKEVVVEVAKRDSDGKMINSTYVKTVNGNAPVNGNVDVNIDTSNFYTKLQSDAKYQTISNLSQSLSTSTTQYPSSNTVKSAVDSKVNTTDIINNVTSTTTNKPLSANMGKELQDQISILKARGRYLSVWNATTGLAMTTPVTPLPYTYSAGDYFIVGMVGSTNYKPTGTQYTGVASSSVETNDVAPNDTYYYDGSSWSLLHTQVGGDVTFASLVGNPSDNTNLASALNAKQNTLTAGSNITISGNTISATDTTYTAGTGISITGNVISASGGGGKQLYLHAIHAGQYNINISLTVINDSPTEFTTATLKTYLNNNIPESSIASSAKCYPCSGLLIDPEYKQCLNIYGIRKSGSYLYYMLNGFQLDESGNVVIGVAIGSIVNFAGCYDTVITL